MNIAEHYPNIKTEIFNLFRRKIEDVSPCHIHLILIVVFELELVYILFDNCHHGSVKGRRLRISCQDLLSNGIIGEDHVC